MCVAAALTDWSRLETCLRQNKPHCNCSENTAISTAGFVGFLSWIKTDGWWLLTAWVGGRTELQACQYSSCRGETFMVVAAERTPPATAHCWQVSLTLLSSQQLSCNILCPYDLWIVEAI